MKAFFNIILLFALLLIFPSATTAASSQVKIPATSNGQSLNNLADQIVQYVSVNQRTASFVLLDAFHKKWNQKKDNYSSNDQQIVETAWDQLQESVSASAPENEQVDNALTLRLCTDSLDPAGHVPMWREMRARVTDLLAQMKKAAVAHQTENYDLALNRFLDVYAMVYPAATISDSENQMKEMDRQVDLLENQREASIQNGERIRQINIVHTEMNQLFSDRPFIDPNDKLYFTGFVSLLLLAAFGYFIWKRHRFHYQKN